MTGYSVFTELTNWYNCGQMMLNAGLLCDSVLMCRNYRVVGMLDIAWEIDTVLGQDRSGLMIYTVPDVKLTFSTVVTTVGVYTTVDIARTFLSVATAVSIVLLGLLLLLLPFIMVSINLYLQVYSILRIKAMNC